MSRQWNLLIFEEFKTSIFRRIVLTIIFADTFSSLLMFLIGFSYQIFLVFKLSQIFYLLQNIFFDVTTLI